MTVTSHYPICLPDGVRVETNGYNQAMSKNVEPWICQIADGRQHMCKKTLHCGGPHFLKLEISFLTPLG